MLEEGNNLIEAASKCGRCTPLSLDGQAIWTRNNGGGGSCGGACANLISFRFCEARNSLACYPRLSRLSLPFVPSLTVLGFGFAATF